MVNTMQRYTISQFDGNTFVVIDQKQQHEVCTCGDFDEQEDAKQLAEKIASLLNASEG